jgi:hypothetical protein
MSGFSKEDAVIEGIVPINQTKMNVGAMFANPIRPESARQALSVKAKRVNTKDTLNSFATEAGKGGTKMREIGGGGGEGAAV